MEIGAGAAPGGAMSAWNHVGLLMALLACHGADDGKAPSDGSSGTPGDTDGSDSPTTPTPVPTTPTTTPTDAFPLCVNELVPDNQDGLVDDTGRRPDWIELFNPTAKDVSLAGWSMDDLPGNIYVYEDAYEQDPYLDPSLVVPAGGTLVLYADGHPERGPLHLPFSLDAMGEGIQLVAPDNRGVYLEWGPVGGDRAIARYPDCCSGSEDCFRYPLLGTPGRSNASATAQTVVVATDAVWRYSDTGIFPGAGWQLPGFDDSAWASGPGPFGYGDQQATVLSAGPDPAAPYVTTWLRTTFELADASHVGAALLRVRRDDGAGVSLNGKDVFWENLPNKPDPTLPATVAVSGADELAWRELSLAPELLQTGTNTLAVEVRQADPAGDDLHFELELRVDRL